MSEERFEVIVVGGGPAGATAALVLAKAGVKVLLVERGKTCGSKNVSGGRLYGHSLEKIIPGFAGKAPVERRITRERVSFLTETKATTLEFKTEEKQDPLEASYSVLRSRFDPWLAKKAEEAGAVVVCGVKVDELLNSKGTVIGIRSGNDRVYADAVVLADGVNSLLAQNIGLKSELRPEETAVGVKEVISLKEELIQERFGDAPGEGTAWMMVGTPTDGTMGGGFLYTNKESVSLGIVVTLEDIGHSELAVTDMLERMKSHPVIAPLIKGGKSVEYSAHLVTEGGWNMIPQLYQDGVIVAGDAAAFVINLGYTVRGMDFAIESGKIAAETLIAAKERNDYSLESLKEYQTRLEDSFIFRDMKRYRDFPRFMSSSHRIYETYAEMINEMMAGIFTVSGSKESDVMMCLAEEIGKVGLIHLMTDGVRGLGALL